MITIDKSTAITNLRPKSNFILREDKLEWFDENELPPTEQEITAEIARLEAEYDSNEYQRKRAAEYPSIQEQLDTLYHGGLTEWKATIKAVKDKYPKE